MNKRRLLSRSSAILSIVILCGCSVVVELPAERPAQGETANREIAEAVGTALMDWLPDQLKEKEVPGAALAIADRENIILKKTFGVTDDPGSPPIRPDTLFNIRSVSKSVTALAVLMAVQDGLVDLDTPISAYLPDFSVHSRFDQDPEDRITLRHMLSHWAGFTHDPPAGIDLGRPGYFQRYVERISDTWLRFPVGYRLEYSNYGVDLAGYILQTRSGKPFPEYAHEKVLIPLGMNDSSFDLELIETRDNRAIGHDTQGRVVPVPLPEIPAAGLYSSIRDMSKYAQFHLNGGVVNGTRVLREDLMEQYHSIQFAGYDQRTGYTLGLWREVTSNTFSLYHEGGGRGYGSHLMLYPELGFGVVLLTNREYHGLTGFQGRAIMNGPILDRYGPNPIIEPEPGRRRPLDAGDPRVRAILGRYGDSPGAVMGFEGGVLGLRQNDSSFSPMTFFDDGGQLVGAYDGIRELRFLPPFGNQPGSFMFMHRAFNNSNSNYLDFNDSPSDPPGPAKQEWQQYLGEYDVIWEDEPDSTVSITIKNGYLYYRDGKCVEYEPGLFFLYDGQALDFRSTPLTFATQEIRRRQ